MTTTTALPTKRRLARNIDDGYEVMIGMRDNKEVWATVVNTLEIYAPIAIVSLTVELDGQQVRLPGVPPTTRLLSRRAAA